MITGKWEISLESPMGAQTSILDLKAEGDVLTGTQTNSDNVPVEISDGVVSGDSFSYMVKFKKPMPMKIKADGKVEGDKISGIAKMAMGKAEFQGTRIS